MASATPGIRRTRSGWQVYVRVRGEFLSHHFPPETTPEKLREERENLRARAQLGITTPDEHGASLSSDVKAYLKAKAGMPTISDRTQRIERWRDVLGKQRARDSVTTLEIRQHLEAWRKDGAKPGTLNHYRTALVDFYAVMNGREGTNPARSVPKYREQELPLSLPTWHDAERAIDKAARANTATHARLRVLLWTGWPGSTLKRLRPQDIHWQAQTATVHGRQKGHGTHARTVPLLPPAIEALRALRAAKGFGEYSGSSLHSALHRGCKASKVRRFRVYDLRHLWITRIVRASPDERGAAELAGHSDPAMTRRYSRHAASERATAALHAAFPMKVAKI